MLIERNLLQMKEKVSRELDIAISDELAFVYLCLKTYFMPKASSMQLRENITEGSGDGGIDFLFFNEEDGTLHFCQCKYSETIAKQDVKDAFAKIEETINDFKRVHTAKYNTKTRELVQNELDRFDKDNEVIQYNLFTISNLEKDSLLAEIDNLNRSFSSDNISLYNGSDISNYLDLQITEVDKVHEDFSLKIDIAKNWLTYKQNDGTNGAFVNVSSKSIKMMYNIYSNKGLLDLNIRKYVRNKSVDDGIKHTLKNERDMFWFYNNGITFACDDFRLDGNTVKIKGFSIVNGGQTTTLIGKDESEAAEFYVPCKLISHNGKKTRFFEKISEATNSQKPIQPRDLKSNSYEMKHMASWLFHRKIILDIKRGEQTAVRSGYRRIRNDDLGQLVLSFVHQQPGTARSKKKDLFDNPTIFSKVYRQGYEHDENKQVFIIDLINLNERYNNISQQILNEDGPTINAIDNASIILKNGKQVIFGIFGLLYQLINQDVRVDELALSPLEALESNFKYMKFFDNERVDDIDERLIRIVEMILMLLSETYDIQFAKKEVTSVSNFFKRDNQYHDDILGYFIKKIRTSTMVDLIKEASIFKRV